MKNALAISVLFALLALSAESFRLPRQAEDEEGTLTKLSSTIKSYYDDAFDAVSGYVEHIKGLKLEERVKDLYTDSTTVMKTYAGIMQDQLFHMFQQQQ